MDTRETPELKFARLLESRFNKKKEEVHGNEFDRNFQRCGGNKLLAESGGRFGTVFLRADFPGSCPQSLHQANHRLFGFSRRAFGFDRGSAFRCGSHRRRPQHFAGLSRKTWRLAHRAVPDSGHADVAQVLDGNRSHDGANSNGFVHEKCLHARRGPADFSVRCRTVQPGRTTLTLNAPNKSSCLDCELPNLRRWVRSPPPLPIILLIGRNLAKTRGGKKGQITPMIRFVRIFFSGTSDDRIVEAWYVSCGWAVLAGKRLFLPSRFLDSWPYSAMHG